MNKLLITLIGTLTVGIALPAFAGPDWQLLQQARKNQHARMQREAVEQPAKAADAVVAKRIVLPLDHGPRAQTTPWENKQRLLRAEQERRLKAESDAASPQDARK